MSWFVADEPIVVELEGCRCPGSPHAHDTVWLRPELDASGGLLGTAAIAETQGTSDGSQMERLGRLYLEYGIVRWSFVDESGAPVPVSRDLIRRLSWDAVYPIADRASDLYSEALMRPLVARASASSSNGHTAGNGRTRAKSTSRPPKSSSALPKP